MAGQTNAKQNRGDLLEAAMGVDRTVAASLADLRTALEATRVAAVEATAESARLAGERMRALFADSGADVAAIDAASLEATRRHDLAETTAESLARRIAEAEAQAEQDRRRKIYEWARADLDEHIARLKAETAEVRSRLMAMSDRMAKVRDLVRAANSQLPDGVKPLERDLESFIAANAVMPNDPTFRGHLMAE